MNIADLRTRWRPPSDDAVGHAELSDNSMRHGPTKIRQAPYVPMEDVELGSWDFWRLNDDLLDGAFATLRREKPIAFFPTLTREDGDRTGQGHWALTRYEDVLFASRHPAIFSSDRGVEMADSAPELWQYLTSMIVQDDQHHQRLRSIVTQAFTPEVLQRMANSIRDRVHRLVRELVDGHPDGRADLVSALAGPLPAQ